MNSLASGAGVSDGRTPDGGSVDTSTLRRAMVDCQVRTFGVTDLDVLSALEDVPREKFLPPGKRALAYSDSPVELVAGGETRHLLAPMIEARMMQLAEIASGARVMVIGAGTGYAAAVLARLPISVTLVETPAFAMEARAVLAMAGADSVRVAEGALSEGHAAGGPYDVILVCGACTAQPSALLAQLADGGRLLMIRRSPNDPTGRAGKAVKVERNGASFSESVLFDAAAPVLPGLSAEAMFAF